MSASHTTALTARPWLAWPIPAAVLVALTLALNSALRAGPSLLFVPTPTSTFTSVPTSTPTLTPTSTSTSTPTPTPTPTPTATPAPTSTSTPSPTPTTDSVYTSPLPTPPPSCPDIGPLPSAEGLPSSPLEGRRLIAYYGVPGGGGLGILGRYDISTTLSLISEQTQVYRELDPSVETITGFHMVVTIADAGPGEDGSYSHIVNLDVVRRWIDGARAAGAISILDIQIGRADLHGAIDVIEPFLWEPDVHLAVDPEWIVGPDRVPGQQVGQITGPQVNSVQARLDDIGRAIGQRKILVIHQFNDRMVVQKECIADYPYVDLVWDADGVGSPGPKIEDYAQYSHEAGFEYGGFKVFYDVDTPVMTPQEVLGLTPPPVVVIYQ